MSIVLFKTLTTWRQLALLSLLMLPAWQASAAWFEAKGQAVVVNGDKAMARQKATQEALKQALLFSGASVKSIQTLTNGLLSNDELQIHASGEVSQVELINETWHDNYVTVRVRADIFPQTNQCNTQDYRRTLSTSYYPILHRQQAQDGQLQSLSEVLAVRLQRQFTHFSDAVSLQHIAPYTAHWNDDAVLGQAPILARQSKTQYVLTGIITDLSVYRPQHSSLAFWKDDTAYRQFGFTMRLVDGMNGGVLLEKQYDLEASWDYDRFAQVDLTAGRFWQSQYGSALDNTLEDMVRDIEEAVSCQPLTGRVIQVAGDRVQVSLGRDHGISVGDELFLYQTRQIQDAFGQSFIQYNIYPGKVKVVSAYADTATVEATDGVVLANIQPNDFVAKR